MKRSILSILLLLTFTAQANESFKEIENESKKSFHAYGSVVRYIMLKRSATDDELTISDTKGVALEAKPQYYDQYQASINYFLDCGKDLLKAQINFSYIMKPYDIDSPEECFLRRVYDPKEMIGFLDLSDTHEKVLFRQDFDKYKELWKDRKAYSPDPEQFNLHAKATDHFLTLYKYQYLASLDELDEFDAGTLKILEGRVFEVPKPLCKK